MKIIGKNYFNTKNTKIYNVIICDTKSKIEGMILYFINFIKNYKDNNPIIGIDFEFNNINNKREIALFQINLETIYNDPTIFLFYPPDLTNNQMNILKELLMTKYIKKIIHGGESLDIPYLFKNIFTTNDEQIMFCKNLYDTKYLCEYYNLANKLTENKCKIYYLLKQMNVVNKKQFDYLLKNEEEMGPIYNIIINVKKMTDSLIKYSTYDVLYLPALLNNFPDTYYYNHIIPELTHIHYILKQTDFFEKQNEKISYFNNIFLDYEYTNIKLIEMYEYMYYWIKQNEVSYLLEITYFKKFFHLIIKSIVYNLITEKYITYEKKGVVNNKKPVNFFNIIDWDNFKYTKELFNKINKDIYNNLLKS
jgi:hypothetical protein